MKMMKIFLIWRLVKQYQYIKIMSIINISEIQEPCIHLFLINQLVIYQMKKISEFLYIEMWFNDQNSNPMEIEDKINTTLVIN